jgi:F0F1-type ATP synthase assembly protein I
MGAMTALLLVLGLAAGWVADRFLHTLPIFTLIGLVIGVAGAGRYIYVEFHKFYND